MTQNFLNRKGKMKNLRLRLLYVFFRICVFFKWNSTKPLSIMLRFAPKDFVNRFMQKLFYKDRETYYILHDYLKYIGRS